ncbi:putative outer membrane starch-binding protein [Tenacibaculum lutimaris]|uniref:Putative outer membrane starch-binding protein n=1 Tax=Tenacibaculum lutimaris TaxID=285258 RepID=A0A420E3V8_9FLAO|nr:RagB/SusD family nutrient uptake outer membrane protein [Tenacibaculum lutimaris]RKF04583.1 putative outer membrane starch-binding protein [Tenacibaculum lutimaris]
MKINFLKSIAACAFIALSYSCSEDFLETSPSQFIKSDDVAVSGALKPEVLAGTVNGMYEMMFLTGTGGDGGHDDFGQKGYDIFSDMLCGDMALSVSTYGWYAGFTDYQSTVDYTNTDNYMPWRYYYRIIRSANLVIDALGGNEAQPTGDNAYNFAQAKAMRAYAYFYLTQFFIEEYNPNTAVLPIYTEVGQPAQPQSPTSEVFDLIIEDLSQAITMLDGFNRSNKSKINQNVAKSLLAYTYAAMDTPASNQMARDLAIEVIQSGEFPLTTKEETTGGFNDVATGSWMWGADLTTEQGLDLISWWGQMDVFTYSYAWAGDAKAIDSNLYAQINANDVRKGQFHPGSGYYNLLPINKFYHPGREIGGQRVVVTDYLYMRIDELYLLAAETAAKIGDDTTAHTYLNALLAERFDDPADYAYVAGLSGQALVDEAYLQTRIELWGEGKSYLAMKRNQATITRGTNHYAQSGVSVAYNDDRLTWDIPQAEIQNNPNINN